jgi:hypothetical protein
MSTLVNRYKVKKDIKMLNKIKKQLSIALASIFMALTFGAGMALAQTPPNVQQGTCTGAELKFQTTPGTACTTFQEEDNVNKVVALVINIFSVVVGIIAVIMIVYGGFRYITSGGDTTKITSARNTILYAIIGLIIVALAQFIVKFVLEKATATTV